MPTIKVTSNLAANGVANPLTGSQYEYLPWPALIEAAILADAGDAINADFFSGSDVVMQNSPLDNKAVTAAIVYPDDFLVQDVAGAGERLGLTLRETAGAAAIARTVIRITRLG
jgi:hypothetical protein